MLTKAESENFISKGGDTFDNALLRAMVDNAVDGIIVIDEQGIVKLMNPAAQRLFGYQTDEVLGKNVAMLMPEPYCGQHDKYIKNYASTGHPKIIGIGREVRGRCKDGKTFPMDLSVAEVKNGPERLFTGIVHDLSERKKAEEALKRERDKAQKYLDLAGVIFILIGADQKVSLINKKGCQVLGYHEHEIVGQNWFDSFIPQRFRDQVKVIFEKIMAGEIDSSEHFENPVLTVNGDERLINWHNTILHDDDGNIIGALSSGEDITEQRIAEEQLRRSEEQLRLTLENAPIGIITTDLEGHLLSVNPAFCALLGYSTDELLKMSIGDFTYPEDVDETSQQFHSLLESVSSSCELEKRYIRKDGETIVVRARGGLVRDSQGLPLLFVAQVEDITKRKRAQQEVQRMRAYLQNIVNSMPSVLVGVDIDGYVTEWNKSAEQATGVTAPKAMGRCFVDLLPYLESQLQVVHEAISLGQAKQMERLVTKRNGETRYSEVMVYPLIANGNAGAVIRVDDITKRIRIEQMMVQTEKMMSVGGLAAGMAHEINNPLSAILQSCQNIKRRLSPELEPNRKVAKELGLDLKLVRNHMDERGIMSFVQGTHDAGLRASRIVRDMLSFSRRSEAHLTPSPVIDTMETVLRLSASDYDLKKNLKKIEIIRDYADNLTEIYCDRTEIEQVLLNLIKNAVYAMFSSKTTRPHRITLRTRKEGQHALLEVIDNGPGMKDEVKRRVFEPFFTTKPVGVGTGLGLSVSYFIITERHHGSISVHSTSGEGTRFTIRLPQPVKSRESASIRD